MFGVFDDLSEEQIQMMPVHLFKKCFLTLVVDVMVNTPSDMSIGDIDELIKDLESSIPGRASNEFIDVLNAIKGEWRLLGEPAEMTKKEFIDMCSNINDKMDIGT